MTEQNKSDFVADLYRRAELKLAELKELNHQLARNKMEAARTEAYINHLNTFLKNEGGEPIEFNPDILEEQKGS